MTKDKTGNRLGTFGHSSALKNKFPINTPLNDATFLKNDSSTHIFHPTRSSVTAVSTPSSLTHSSALCPPKIALAYVPSILKVALALASRPQNVSATSASRPQNDSSLPTKLLLSSEPYIYPGISTKEVKTVANNKLTASPCSKNSSAHPSLQNRKAKTLMRMNCICFPYCP